MADDQTPGLGELGRLIQALRGDVRESIGQLNGRLDKLVHAEVYAAEKASMAKDIRDLELAVEALRRQRDLDAERVTQTRRWMLASVVIPILGLVVPVALFLMGSK